MKDEKKVLEKKACFVWFCLRFLFLFPLHGKSALIVTVVVL